MKKLLLLLIIIPHIIIGQNLIGLPQEMVGEDKVSPLTTDKFAAADFSGLWLDNTNNQPVLGIIGEEHQRIKVKILEVVKDANNHLIYHVTGKTSVMGNVCDFSGVIRINEVYLLTQHNSLNQKESDQAHKGLVIAEYYFREDSTQYHVGIFEGKLYSLWKSSDFNNIISVEFKLADNFINNAFIGTWSSYSGNDNRLCNWGIFRVPGANKDFDAGSAKFSPSEKYHKYGWKSYYKAYVLNDLKAKREEDKQWWNE